jgi:autotransporter-associated beta strand protein
MAFIMLFLLVAAASARAASYYVDDTGGSDPNAGTTTNAAWQTLAKVNAHTFAAGDALYFKAGGHWTNQLVLKGSGATNNPIILDQYGTGPKPFINGNGYTSTVLLQNVAGWEVNNLEIINNGGTTQGSYPGVSANAYVSNRVGVLVYATTAAIRSHLYFRNLNIHHVFAEVSGAYNKNVAAVGLKVDQNKLAAYCTDILVENCQFSFTGYNGLNVTKPGYSDPNYFYHQNIIFRGNTFTNTGGSGMQITRGTGILVESNITDSTGSSADSRMFQAGDGFWPYGSSNVVCQHNLFKGAHGTTDCTGMHVDSYCYSVWVQYNRFVGNQGGFVEILGACSNIVYRYNVSINDGWRTNGQTGKLIWLDPYAPPASIPPTNVFIYNNTAYVPALNPGYAPLGMTNHITITPNSGNVSIQNNLFIIAGTTVYDPTAGSNTGNFSSNLWFGNRPVGLPASATDILLDPQVINPGGTNAEDYRLMLTSPAIGAGTVITNNSWLVISNNNGGLDYWGTPLPAGKPCMGAVEQLTNLFRLTVTSPVGSPSPNGITTNSYGALINALANSPIVNGNTQTVAVGWSGTGSAGSGTGAVASFYQTADSTLTWLWQTNVFVAATWTNPASGSWVTDANWNPQAPGSTSTTNTIDTATFGGAIAAPATVTMDANRNIFSLSFLSTSNAYTLTGGSLLLTAGGGIQTSGGGSNHTDSIASPITLQGDATFTANAISNSRLLSIAGNVTGSAASGNVSTLNFTGSNTGANSISGVIADGLNGGQLALVKSGAGTWSLTDSVCTYTGPTTITAGSLNMVGTSQLGGGTYAQNIVNNGTLYYKSSAGQTLNGTISGSGIVDNEFSSSGSLTLNAPNSYTGGTINRGKLIIANPNACGTGQLQLLGGTLDATVTNLAGNLPLSFGWDWTFAGSTNLNLGTGAVSLSANRTNTVTKNTLTVGGPVSGSAAFNKAGAGTIILGGTNTYTGSTTIYAGTLLVNGNSLAATNIWTVVGGATLGGTGRVGSVVNYQNGSVASFTVTPTNTSYRNTTYLTFTNVVFMTNLTVKVSLPAVLGNGVYVLATNYVGFTTSGSLTFATNSGSLASGASGSVSVAGNSLILTVSGGAPTIAGQTNFVTPFVTTYGTASDAQTYLVTAANLTSYITNTAAPGFEVSADGGVTYGSTAIVTNAGTNTSATVYIRLSATASAGTYNSSNIVVLTSVGAASVTNTSSAGGNIVYQSASTWNYSNPGPFAYDGTAKTPTISFSGSTGTATTNYVGTGTTIYASTNAPTGLGTYYVSNTVAADLNYLGATNSQQFVINGPGAFSGISVSGTALILTVTNGIPNATWTLLQSTNLALQLSQWTTNLTGTYDSGGNLTTNLPTATTNAAMYFILE